MTSAREAGEILSAARARDGAPPPRTSSPSAPPEDPAPNSREDVGYRSRARRPAPAPITDEAFLRAIPKDQGTYEGARATGDALAPWCAILRRPDGRGVGLYGPTEADALREARRYVERGGLAT